MTQELPLFTRARGHGERVAIRSEGRNFTYRELLAASAAVAVALLAGETDLAEARVAFQAPAGFAYFAIQWGIWRAGGIAMPLSLSATTREKEQALEDSGARIFVGLRGNEPPAGLRGLVFEELDFTAAGPLPELAPDRRAMLLLTSGTTSRPKGVVTTHANLQAQIESLVAAWEWSADDRIPLFLPMHHIHGIVNIAGCALWSGAAVETFPRFEMAAVLARVAAGAWSVFMAVPTIYVKLIEALEAGNVADRAAVLRGFGAMRLMVSGSSALPPSVHETWTALTGQNLLERYGMTETGMMISNPLHGERRPGSVGLPLPGVEIRLVSELGETVTADGEPGEIQVRGPVVFREYWGRPEATAEAFAHGWFRTGDLAVVERGYFRIMGRLSVDIIKSGGYKLSALEIEAALLEHPAIRECAVVGIPDATWGEMVAAAVVLEPGQDLEIEALRTWCRDRLSAYKIPRRLLPLARLPRNAMGKTMKQALAARFETAPDCRKRPGCGAV
jgi:malonyl-CoA/methylmalonyl-CoA synthetase